MLKITEKEFQEQILDLARLQNWLRYHTWNSRRSQQGFPDLVLIRPPRVIFAELKVGDNDLSPYQRIYRELLLDCPGVEHYVWRPEGWDEIEEVLRRTR